MCHSSTHLSASLFRATVNNDHGAGDSKSFLCPRIKYCTFYALLRQMVTPRTNRMSRMPQCTFCLLHQSTGRCRGKNNVCYAVAFHQPLNLRIVTSYPPLFLDCKLTSETKCEQDSIYNHTVYHSPEWLQSFFSFLYSEQPKASYLETSIIQKTCLYLIVSNKQPSDQVA